MAYLEPNRSAETTISILTELIKAGRYTSGAVSIDSMTKEGKRPPETVWTRM